MSRLCAVVDQLLGQGVRFTVEAGGFLRVINKSTSLTPEVIEVIKQHKPFILSVLPYGQAITARQLQEAIEHYQEREAIMLESNLAEDQAATHASQCTRTFLSSLLIPPLSPP